MALVLLTLAFPGSDSDSFLNCKQLEISALRVALLKWLFLICDWIGLIKNWETCGDRSCSHVRVVSHF